MEIAKNKRSITYQEISRLWRTWNLIKPDGRPLRCSHVHGIEMFQRLIPRITKYIAMEQEEDSEVESETEDSRIWKPDSKGVAVDDPVRMYLKEIGKVALRRQKKRLSWRKGWRRGTRKRNEDSVRPISDL